MKGYVSFGFVVMLVLAALGGVQPVAAQDDATPEPGKTVNVEIIIDVSGSMGQATDAGETRMEAAKEVLQDVVDGIPDREGVNVGLRLYGHEGDNTAGGQAVSCQSSELVVPVEGVDKDALRDAVDQLQPTGWTPIALSLQRAADDFMAANDDNVNVIVLVTDGLETCGGDPCAASSDLHDGDLGVTTNVVGFGVTPDEQAILGCISENGGGDLLGAANAGELSDAVFSILVEEVPDIETPAPAPRADQPESGPTGSRENPIPLGTAADVGGDWFISVVDVVPDATEMVMTENQFNDPPAAGTQFYLVRISATYEGEGSSTLPAMNVFKVVGDSSVAYEQFRDRCGVFPEMFPATDVFTGGVVEGNLCWAVKTSDVDSLVMYSEDFFTFDPDNQVWFALRE